MNCTDLALLINSEYWAFELPMHCTVLLLLINSHHRLFKLDSSLFMYSSDLEPFLHRHFFKFGLYSSVFIHCIDRPLTLNSHYCASEFFCSDVFFIAKTLLSLPAVINADSSSILLFLRIL